jgi:hypothetical protein
MRRGGGKREREVLMRSWIAVTLAGAAAAATLALGAAPVSAAARFTCTRMAGGHAAAVTVRFGRAGDALQARGFICTGD